MKASQQVAGQPSESVTQPRWSPAGVLHYVSDRSGWWNLYDETGLPLCPLDAEFARPDWVFGNSHLRVPARWAAGGRVVRPGRDHLGIVAGAGPNRKTSLFPTTASCRPLGRSDRHRRLAHRPPSVVRLDLDGRGADVLRRSRAVPIDEAAISAPEAVEFPTAGGEVAHALFYAAPQPELRRTRRCPTPRSW